MSNNLAKESLHIGCTQYKNLQNKIDVTAQQLRALTDELETITSLEDKLIHAEEKKGNFVLGKLTQQEKDLFQQFEPGFSEVPLTEHQRDNVLEKLKRLYSTKVEMEVKPLQNKVFRDEESKNLWVQLIAMVVNRHHDAMDRIVGNIGR